VVGDYIDGLALSGDWVVWRVWHGRTGLYAYNLKTRRSLTLVRRGGGNGPEIVGSWVVWNNGLNMDGPTLYYARDFATGARRVFSL
jgi:hypothetical protein